MQINNTHTNQTFGMSYKTKNTTLASRKIAEKINSYGCSEAVEKFFTEQIAKPIKCFSTEVETDGEKVILENPITKIKYEILDKTPTLSNEDKHVVNYYVKQIGEQSNQKELKFPIRYEQLPRSKGSNYWDAVTYDGIIRKHVIARELGKDLENQVKALIIKNARKSPGNKRIAAIALRLENLFA